MNCFIPVFKQRIIDTFTQEWQGSLSSSSVLDLYKYFKISLTYEPYLDNVPNDIRHFITKARISARISAHALRVHTERFSRNRIPRENRYCLICNKEEVEDIYHFICICPVYNELRRIYLETNIYVRPSVYKMCSLINSHDKKVLNKLAAFLKKATILRNNISVNVI